MLFLTENFAFFAIKSKILRLNNLSRNLEFQSVK